LKGRERERERGGERRREDGERERGDMKRENLWVQ